MIGIVIVTHGRLAEELLAAAEHVVGKLDGVRAISIGPDDDMAKRQSEIKTAVEDVDVGQGVIVVADMFGGTPANLAISLLSRGKVEVVAGVNVPMLIKLAEERETKSVEACAQAAIDAGRKYIAVASQVLDGNAR